VKVLLGDVAHHKAACTAHSHQSAQVHKIAGGQAVLQALLLSHMHARLTTSRTCRLCWKVLSACHVLSCTESQAQSWTAPTMYQTRHRTALEELTPAADEASSSLLLHLNMQSCRLCKRTQIGTTRQMGSPWAPIGQLQPDITLPTHLLRLPH
jgi:hypothetical protein